MFSDSKSLSDLRSLNLDGGLLTGCQRKQKFSAIFQPLRGAMKKKGKKISFGGLYSYEQQVVA